MLANVGQSVIYKNDPVALEKAREQEKSIAVKYQEEHVKWLHTTEGRAIARVYWKKHGFDEKNLYPGVDLPPGEGEKRF
jgi:hypothetical protein